MRERGRIVDAEQKVSVRFGKPRGACDTSDEVASENMNPKCMAGLPGAGEDYSSRLNTTESGPPSAVTRNLTTHQPPMLNFIPSTA